MPSADKRARKKDNARAAREQREAALKRKKRTRSIVTVGVVVALFFGVIVLLNAIGGKSKKKTPAAPVTKNGCSTAVPAKGKKHTFSAPTESPFTKGRTYTAVVSTSCGTFSIQLDTKNAPKGAANFDYLASQGFYDGLAWTRAATDFVIQGGDPTGTGSGGPGYHLTTETPKAGFKVGDVGWAKTGSDPAGTAGSQFFVVAGGNIAALNQKVGGKIQYGDFGKVASGLSVAKKIMSFAPAGGDGAPTQAVYIKTITIKAS